MRVGSKKSSWGPRSCFIIEPKLRGLSSEIRLWHCKLWTRKSNVTHSREEESSRTMSNSLTFPSIWSDIQTWSLKSVNAKQRSFPACAHPGLGLPFLHVSPTHWWRVSILNRGHPAVRRWGLRNKVGTSLANACAQFMSKENNFLL